MLVPDVSEPTDAAEHGRAATPRLADEQFPLQPLLRRRWTVQHSVAVLPPPATLQQRLQSRFPGTAAFH